MSRRSEKIIVGQKHRLRQWLLIVGVSFCIGIGYPTLNGQFGDMLAFVNGGAIGLIGGLGVALHHDLTVYGRIRRKSFWRKMITVALVYTLGFAILIILVTGFSRSIENNETFIDHVRGSQYQQFLFHGHYKIILLYALILSFILSFVFIMSHKVDGRVLWNLVSGKYVNPRQEYRIVMFLDMNNSTSIAEKLGEIRYFSFVNDFFADITPSILRMQGEIYRYVGDEIVVTWKRTNNQSYANSIRTYFLARNELKRQAEKYINRYNIVPSFKAVFHSGLVTVGEIGDVKSQIALHGDVMYVTGLIEKECNKKDKPILVSSTMIEEVTLPGFYKVEKCGNLEALGKEIDLYSISEME